MLIHFLRSGKRMLAGGLVLLMLCSPVGGLLTPAWAQMAAPGTAAPLTTILLFPFANNGGAAAQSLGPRLDDALKLRLDAVGVYKVTAYRKFLASVQRAIQDNVLTQDDLSKASSDPQAAARIAAQVTTDSYLMGAVESYSADPNTRRVSIEVSADLRSTQTGNSIRTLAFTGTAAPTSNAETLDSVIQRAVNTAASRIAASVNSGQTTHTVLPTSQRGHSNAGQKVLLTVLAGALVFAILHNSSGNSNSSDGTTTTPTNGGGSTGGGGSPGVPNPPGI